MKKSILILVFFTTINFSFAQITQYFNREEWRMATENICALENFESFTNDLELRTAPVQCNGFTLHQDVGGGDRNEIDVVPIQFAYTNGTNYASLYLDGDEPIEVLMSFDHPTYGFFADYLDLSAAEGIMHIYNMDDIELGTYSFTMNNISYGIISEQPISSVRFTAIQANGVGGEGFGMDNIEIDCGPPVPTLSQWGTLLLSLFLLILGIVAMNNFIFLGLEPGLIQENIKSSGS